jgi:hypothetical protein
MIRETNSHGPSVQSSEVVPLFEILEPWIWHCQKPVPRFYTSEYALAAKSGHRAGGLQLKCGSATEVNFCVRILILVRLQSGAICDVRTPFQHWDSGEGCVN